MGRKVEAILGRAARFRYPPVRRLKPSSSAPGVLRPRLPSRADIPPAAPVRNITGRPRRLSGLGEGPREEGFLMLRRWLFVPILLADGARVRVVAGNAAASGGEPPPGDGR